MDIPRELIQTIYEAKHIVVLTGAGISAESGIPTFRQAQTGLWARYDPEELATVEAFKANPKLVWRWYRWRQGIVRKAEPNNGHFALAQMESILNHRGLYFTLITQNIDGLHQQAGNKNIIELHGNINRSRCISCGEIIEEHYQQMDDCPDCLQCGEMMRPDVIWFGENLPELEIQSSWQAAQQCDFFVSIGTSAIVHPAASLPLVALQNGATVAEINPDDTPITGYMNYQLKGVSGQILPHLVKSVWQKKE